MFFQVLVLIKATAVNICRHSILKKTTDYVVNSSELFSRALHTIIRLAGV